MHWMSQKILKTRRNWKNSSFGMAVTGLCRYFVVRTALSATSAGARGSSLPIRTCTVRHVGPSAEADGMPAREGQVHTLATLEE